MTHSFKIKDKKCPWGGLVDITLVDVLVAQAKKSPLLLISLLTCNQICSINRMFIHKAFSFQKHYIFPWYILCKKAKMVRKETMLVAFTCILVVASIAVSANATAAPRLLATEQVYYPQGKLNLLCLIMVRCWFSLFFELVALILMIIWRLSLLLVCRKGTKHSLCTNMLQ